MLPELIDRRAFQELQESYTRGGLGLYLNIRYDETLPDIVLDIVDRAFARQQGHAHAMSYFDGRWHFLGMLRGGS